MTVAATTFPVMKKGYQGAATFAKKKSLLHVHCVRNCCFDHRLTECSQHMHVPAVNEQHVPAARKKRNTTRREQKNSRKRMRQENKWHRVQSKNNREKGFSYTSYNGNVVPAKSVRSSEILCREKCKRKCSEKIDMSHRQHIFDSFYALDTNSKNCYLFKSIKPVKPQVQRMQAKKHREMSFHYEVVVNGETIIVCKKAFETLHQITSMKIYHLTNRLRLEQQHLIRVTAVSTAVALTGFLVMTLNALWNM